MGTAMPQLSVIRQLQNEWGLGTELRPQSMHGSFGWTGKNMASVSDNLTTNRADKSVVLTESDIPGAKIPRDSLMECSVPRAVGYIEFVSSYR